MTDFSHRAQKDPEFSKVYHEQKKLFFVIELWKTTTLRKSMVIWAWFTAVSGVIGRLQPAAPLIKFKM